MAGKDASALARKIVAMSPEEFTAAFAKSPTKRAKLRDLRRNAAVVIGNIRMMGNLSALQQALADSEPPVRGHVV